MPDILPYTQQEFNQDVEILVDKIRESAVKYDLIIGLARGGLLPGVALSHKLNVPFLAVNWSKTYQELNGYVWDTIIASKQNVLIVDDMVDSGELLVQLLESLDSWATWDDGELDTSKLGVAVLINNTDVETLYSNDKGIIKVNYCAREISRKVTPSWIEYWWEQK